MKYTKERIKSKFHHRGTLRKIGATKKPTQKGAFGKKKEFEIKDDTRASSLPKCRVCGLATSQTDSYGQPLCEWCKEDYKALIFNK